MTLLTTVVPAIGTVLAALLGASGVPGMLGDRRVGSLSTDPTPFPVAFTANVAWCVYGVSLGDFWPFLCNIAPSLCNLFCTITCLRLSGSVSARVAVRIEILMLVGMAILLALMLLSCSSLVVASEAHRQAIASGACLTLCICQFLSPCTEAVFAALRGDASKLSLPLAGTGALCCGFWCVYGLAAEQPAMAISNGIGCLLSVSVALTKLVVGFLHAPTGGGADGTPTEVLLKLADEGKEIQLHSISQELASPLGARRQRQTTAEPADVLADQPAISASATPPPPSAAAWSLVKVGDGHVAFRLAEGGFLCVAPRAGDLPADLCTPTGFVIEMHHGDSPGDAGRFLPVDAPRLASEAGAMHQYAEDAIAFYNPLHRVFMRLTPNGELDCSSTVNPVEGKVTLPAGWVWERFRPAPAAERDSSTHQVRRRAGATTRSAV